jgi:YHS domain-containing protein
MTVEPASASDCRSSAQGTVYFCSPGCGVAFDANPGHYAVAS